MTIEKFAAAYVAELKACLDEISLVELERAAGALARAWAADRSVYVFGNGGSAATASHIASDLSRSAAGGTRPGLRAVCLTDNVAALTAMANDTSYEGALAEMLALQLRPGDVVIAISGSGDSPNILRAVDLARQRGATTIGLVGFGGGALGHRVEVSIAVRSRHYGAVEDLHLALGHLLSMYLAGPERMADPGGRPASSLGTVKPVTPGEGDGADRAG